jgi:transcriptional regulator with XRE-family HTH domain
MIILEKEFHVLWEGKVSLREQIRRLREEAGLSQQQLASQAGVTRSLINKLEDGVTGNPTLDKLQRIAAALHTSVACLTGEGYAIPNNLRDLALKNGLSYMEVDTLVLMTFEGKESTTMEEWNHILRSAREFPELYRRLGKLKE